jgi:ADP-ribose pyrophosphatase
MTSSMDKSNILSKKIVFQSRYFQVEQWDVERNGKIFTKDFVIRKPHVLILPITDKNEIYLIREYRDALQKVSLEVVAGFMEENEDPLEGAKRELKEETGLEAKEWKELRPINVSPNMVSVAHVFLAKGLTEGEPDFDDDEEIELIKMSIDEAVKKVMDGELDTSSHMAVLLLLDKLKQEGKL